MEWSSLQTKLCSESLGISGMEILAFLQWKLTLEIKLMRDYINTFMRLNSNQETEEEANNENGLFIWYLQCMPSYL